jgi:AraC-like DNA-binding protein
MQAGTENGSASATAALRVSTDAMPARERVAFWREEFGHGFLRVDIAPDDNEHFHADATVRALPGLKIASVEISSSYWQRTAAMVAQGGDDFGMMFRLGGPAVHFQHGQSIELGPGDAAAISHMEPASLALPNASGRNLGLVIPLAPLKALVGNVDSIMLQHLRAESETLRLLKSYLGILEDDLTLADPELCQAAVTHVHDLIALAMGATREGAEVAGGRGLRAARLRAVKTDILASLSSRDLSVTAVAKRQNITPRYVHMLFEAEGITFSQFVLAERLARAKHMLVDARLDRQTIAAVAYAAGFGDLSHFNRAFRRRYGATPSELRATKATTRAT